MTKKNNKKEDEWPVFVNIFEPIQHILDKLNFFEQQELVQFFMDLYEKENENKGGNGQF